jgi:hypothetical protein
VSFHDVAVLCSSALTTLLVLAFNEAFLKPFLVRQAHSIAPEVIARGLEWLDLELPGVLGRGEDGSALEERVRRRLNELTGEEWKAIKRDFDVEVFLTKYLKARAVRDVPDLALLEQPID